ncbi:unnamed protein product [Linum tenue]|nr:unnamed protein product [Linum tenue]
MGGPWMIGDYYITVRPWRRNFNPKLAEVASTMAWARLPGLPSEFINKEAVERIASRIGRPVRVDRATQLGSRGRFARVCVEVDLTKPLLSQYKIEGITYYIEYEGLHRICTECGMYGHMRVTCPKLFEVIEPVVEPENKTTEEVTKRPLYGEWMTAKPKWKSSNGKQFEKRTTEKQQRGPSVTEEIEQTSGSRFAALNEEEQMHTDSGLKEPRVEHQESVVVEKPGEKQALQPDSATPPEKRSAEFQDVRPIDEISGMDKVDEASNARIDTQGRSPPILQPKKGPIAIQVNLKGQSNGGKGKVSKSPSSNSKLKGDMGVQQSSRKGGSGTKSVMTEGAGSLSPSGDR